MVTDHRTQLLCGGRATCPWLAVAIATLRKLRGIDPEQPQPATFDFQRVAINDGGRTAYHGGVCRERRQDAGEEPEVPHRSH